MTSSMRAIQIVNDRGPREALTWVDAPLPDVSHPRADGDDVVLIEVHASGASFPELMLTHGSYHVQPPLPFIPGSEVAGVVRSAPAASGFNPGDPVIGLTDWGGWAEVAAAPTWLTVPLHPKLDFAQGAALLMNYHTAYFALVMRGRLGPGDSLLVHGAAGGVGSAALQIARGLGITTHAVVSSQEKAEFATRAGADIVSLSSENWKERAVSSGGVDGVLDPVGGDRVTDSLRSLREGGRLIVVGFASGTIPSVRLNRLLLRNLDAVGVEWDWALRQPELQREITARVDQLIDAGAVSPIVGHRFAFDDAVAALELLERREALGKVVLEVSDGSAARR